MRKMFAALACLGVLMVATAEEPKTTVAKADVEIKGKSCTFTISTNISFKGDATTDRYHFQWGDTNGHILTLNPMPAGASSRDMVKSMVDFQATSFHNMMKQSEKFTSVKKEKSDVKQGTFEGVQVHFTMETKTEGPMHQYMLGLWDGKTVWNGNYLAMGSNDVATAHGILKKAKPIANK